MRRIALAAIVLCAALAGFLTVQAGNLQPPGPPGPTMKKIDDLPGTPLREANLPLTITAPDSYYLAEPIVASGGGITIAADNVTIDLMGYSLEGGTGDGIVADPNTENIIIKNGTVADWTGTGVSLVNAKNALVINILAEGNDTGIAIGSGSSVIDSEARENIGIGIAAAGGKISGCTAVLNGEHGISVTSGSLVINCIANDNGRFGIYASEGSAVIESVAFSNDETGFYLNNDVTLTGCTSSDNSQDGVFVTGIGSTLRDNTASGNTSNGITVSGSNLVLGNHCVGNTGGAGIEVRSTNNRIEGNTVTDNLKGVYVTDRYNLIVRNVASDNTVNFDIHVDNLVGTIVSDTTGMNAAENDLVNVAF